VNAPHLSQIKAKLGRLRLVHVLHLVAVPILVWVANMVPSACSDEWSPWHWVIASFALYSVSAGFFFRQRLMHSVEGTLQKGAFDAKAVKQWQAAQHFGITAAITPALCGWFLQMFLCSTVEQAAPFYAASLLLLLLWTPRIPTTALSD
jgi:hypothetical protein